MWRKIKCEILGALCFYVDFWVLFWRGLIWLIYKFGFFYRQWEPEKSTSVFGSQKDNEINSFLRLTELDCQVGLILHSTSEYLELGGCSCTWLASPLHLGTQLPPLLSPSSSTPANPRRYHKELLTVIFTGRTLPLPDSGLLFTLWSR